MILGQDFHCGECGTNLQRQSGADTYTVSDDSATEEICYILYCEKCRKTISLEQVVVAVSGRLQQVGINSEYTLIREDTDEILVQDDDGEMVMRGGKEESGIMRAKIFIPTGRYKTDYLSGQNDDIRHQMSQICNGCNEPFGKHRGESNECPRRS